jgi:tetraacyldisaccharide 4'-kinase
MPAGPLRETLRAALARADALVLIGEDRAGVGSLFDGLILRARLVPGIGAEEISSRDVVAFAGIGRPQKFFATLEEIGARVVFKQEFPDHHPYTADEVMHLVEGAVSREAIPVTTEKDAVRLPPEACAMVKVLAVEIEWEAPGRLDGLLKGLA